MSAFSVQCGSLGVLFKWSTWTRECVNKIYDLSLLVNVKRGFLKFCTTRLERWCAYQVRHWKSMSTYHVGVIYIHTYLNVYNVSTFVANQSVIMYFFINTKRSSAICTCLVCAIRVLFICDYYCFSTTVINHMY